MVGVRKQLKKWGLLLLMLAVATCASLYDAAAATPTVTGFSGTFGHGEVVTITGTNFGTKSPAAPALWDDGTGTNINALWNRAEPSASTDSNCDIDYRTNGFRSTNASDSNDTGFIGGAHCGSGASSGNNVILAKSVSFPDGGYYYSNFYYRHDDNWQYCSDTGCSSGENTKTMTISESGYYQSQNYWYAQYRTAHTSCASSGNWHMNDDCIGSNGDCFAGSSVSGGSATNPCGSWVMVEEEMKHGKAPSGSGSYKIWDNGTRRINYSGYTVHQNWNNSSTSFGIGGYNRSRHANNYRYFDSVYMDNTRAKVLLCPDSSYADFDANHGICHPQPPSAWSSTSITITVNQGAFAGSATAYVYVMNDSGEISTTPLTVTIDGTGASTQCNDSVDNDGDGDVDLADSGCVDANDQSEALCGDDYLDGNETCDGTALSGNDCTTIPGSSYVGGTLGCLSDCSDYDTSLCTHGTDITISSYTTVNNVDPNSTSYCYAHTHDEGTESGLVVLSAGLGDSASDACNITAITWDGQSLTMDYELPDMSGSPATKSSHASAWHLFEPNQTTSNVCITFNGDKCNRFYSAALSYINVDTGMFDDAGGEIEEAGDDELRWTTSALETDSLCADIVIADGTVALTQVPSGMTEILNVTSPDEVRITYGTFTTNFTGGWDSDTPHSGVPWIYIAGCYLEEQTAAPPDPGGRCEGVTLSGVSMGSN